MVLVEVDGVVLLHLSSLLDLETALLCAPLQCVELLLDLVGRVRRADGCRRRRCRSRRGRRRGADTAEAGAVQGHLFNHRQYE